VFFSNCFFPNDTSIAAFPAAPLTPPSLAAAPRDFLQAMDQYPSWLQVIERRAMCE
jgi:hypothetical protein